MTFEEDMKKHTGEFLAKVKESVNRMVAPEPVKTGKPDKGDWYWYINGHGEIVHIHWNDDDFDNRAWAIGNVYLTKEPAEKALDRMKVKQELKELAGGYEFKFCEHNYYIYTNREKEFGSYWSNLSKSADNIYFETREDCRHAIDTIGRERLLNYFEVV